MLLIVTTDVNKMLPVNNICHTSIILKMEKVLVTKIQFYVKDWNPSPFMQQSLVTVGIVPISKGTSWLLLGTTD